jgi:hypothetical protein
LGAEVGVDLRMIAPGAEETNRRVRCGSSEPQIASSGDGWRLRVT